MDKHPAREREDGRLLRRRRLLVRVRGKITAFLDWFLGGGFEQMEFGMERNRDFDLEVRSDEIVVTANVSGFAADEIDVERRDKTLTIRGVKRQVPRPVRNATSEMRKGSAFKHSMLLPEAAAGESLETEYRRGVLHVHVPRIHTAHSTNVPH